MKLHCLNSKIDQPNCYDAMELCDYEHADLDRAGIVEAWYTYGYGSYEGGGHMIAKNIEGKWAYFDLGHCSCYGPCEDLDAKAFTSDTLDHLIARMTDELRAQVAHLIEEVK